MAHRALIVDDSRSARALLKRLLENFGLNVHSVESAEQALTWLQSERPDVVFMDHLMPGMDGFAAVKVIKSDPQTASIPVVMYTSQEGELYLSQARALGAMGVLPKTLKSADVADVLAQLNMIKVGASNGKVPAVVTRDAPVEVLQTPRDEPLRPLSRDSLREPIQASDNQAAAKSAGAALAHRIAMDLASELPALKADIPATLRFWKRVAGVCAVLLVVALGVIIWLLLAVQTQLKNLHVAAAASAAQQVAAQANAAPLNIVPPAATNATDNTAPKSAEDFTTLVATEPVAYAEVPLSGVRLEKLRALVSQLRAKGTPSVVLVEMFSADFCLVSSGNTYQMAADDLPIGRCDVVGNPFGDALNVQQRQSVAFANFVNTVNNGRGTVIINVADGGREPVAVYPARNDSLTAGQWNAVATRNQRVEFSVVSSR